MVTQQIQVKRTSIDFSNHCCRRSNIPTIGILLLTLPLLQTLLQTSIHGVSVSALLIPQFTGNMLCSRRHSQNRVIQRISRMPSFSYKAGAGKDVFEDDVEVKKNLKRDKVMSFLRKSGRIGSNKDFSTAIGVDEGPAGQIRGGVSQVTKAANAYKWCTETGIIDDMSENLPRTSSGTEWSGFTDKVMGGVSIGKVVREVVDGRNANVMKGKVSLYNNGGFIQMAASLSTDPAVSLTVDASNFDGVELDVLYRGSEDIEKFNIHLRNPACLRQFSSYRGTFEVRSNEWVTVRLPWSSFVGHGPGSDSVPFDTSELRRIGIVAIGKAMEVYLAVSSVKFYSNV